MKYRIAAFGFIGGKRDDYGTTPGVYLEIVCENGLRVRLDDIEITDISKAGIHDTKADSIVTAKAKCGVIMK